MTSDQPPVVVVVLGSLDASTRSMVQELWVSLGLPAQHVVAASDTQTITYQQFEEWCHEWAPHASKDTVLGWVRRGWMALLVAVPELSPVCTICDQHWGDCRCEDKGRYDDEKRRWVYHNERNNASVVMAPHTWALPFNGVMLLGNEQWERIHPATRARLQSFVNYIRPD